MANKFVLASRSYFFVRLSRDPEVGESALGCGLDIPFHRLALRNLLAPNWKTAPSPKQLQAINKALHVEFPFTLKFLDYIHSITKDPCTLF